MHTLIEENIKYFKQGNPPIVIIENFYDNEEISLIWRELEFLTSDNKLLGPELTSSARDNETNLPIKKNKGLFLDAAYRIREISDILTINRKLFRKNLYKKLAEISPFFRPLEYCNWDTTLISYYEDEGIYPSHSDTSIITALTYFFKEPKQFFGGDLIFNDFDIKIQIENNMLVIFPGVLTHEVTEIKMKNHNLSGLGRYCMSQFINYKI